MNLANHGVLFFLRYTLASWSLTSGLRTRLLGTEGLRTAGLARPIRSQSPSTTALSIPPRLLKPPVTMSGTSGNSLRIIRANSRKKASRALVRSDFSSSWPSGPSWPQIIYVTSAIAPSTTTRTPKPPDNKQHHRHNNKPTQNSPSDPHNSPH